ncbi:Abi family protein [Aerococcus agrisoli]|uniref:Abi family protein n=1 Tax=Aerococcus agrisoli TaxID=2487350 RepID=UPI001F46EEDA|nr:Abi family protein [Aerococcus agrisoli]
MLFIKEFSDLNSQLNILNQRGLIIRDFKKAKKYLLTNNYYNIINGYSKYFQVSTDVYYPNATFEEITHLYFFDQQLKQYTFRTIKDAENHIKSITAYYYAKYYHNVPYAYLEETNYAKKNIGEIRDTIKEFNKLLNKYRNKKSNNPIKHHTKLHNDVPIWVIIQYLTFGQLYYFIKSLPDTIKSKICSSLYSFLKSHDVKITSPLTNEILDSLLKNILELRNKCAHDQRLISFSCKADVKYYKNLHEKYGIKKEASGERRDYYNTFILLQCFTSKAQFNKLHNSIRKTLMNLEKKISSIEINTLLQELGFPNNWHKKIDKLPQY